MIQFNLLPDVKLEYIKAQRSRRLIISISVLVSVVSLVILGVLVGYNRLQQKHLSDLSRDITSESSKLQSEPQINKILTVQNQLESLSTLDGQKPAVSRLFSYLNSLTPNPLSISNYNSDFNAHTVTITGSANALSTVNQFVDTLKDTTYGVKDDTTNTQTKAFSDVVLSSFGLSTGAQAGQNATYTLTFAYDPTIFDITKDVSLTIPTLAATRTSTGSSTDLFTAAPAATSSTGSTSTGSKK